MININIEMYCRPKFAANLQRELGNPANDSHKLVFKHTHSYLTYLHIMYVLCDYEKDINNKSIWYEQCEKESGFQFSHPLQREV